jgi:selenocysteine lyase/cysteine desulfurase
MWLRVKIQIKCFNKVNPFYQKTKSNIHRGSQELGREATDMYEEESD